MNEISPMVTTIVVVAIISILLMTLAFCIYCFSMRYEKTPSIRHKNKNKVSSKNIKVDIENEFSINDSDNSDIPEK